MRLMMGAQRSFQRRHSSAELQRIRGHGSGAEERQGFQVEGAAAEGHRGRNGVRERPGIREHRGQGWWKQGLER